MTAQFGTPGASEFISGTANVDDEIYAGDQNDLLTGRLYDSFTGTGLASAPITLNFIDTFPSDNDVLEGGTGDDVIYGADGNDALYGGDGNESGVVQVGFSLYNAGLFGGSGDDYIDGGRGNDLLDGGTGNDNLYGGEGNDNAYGADGNDFIDGGQGDDFLYGQDGDDTMFGGTGNDQLKGGGGTDFLAGGLGDDSLGGNDGNDILRGGDGNDRLDGGLGKDLLTGGAGHDTFFFQLATESPKSSGRDVIKDFSHAQNDKIDLDLMDANTKKAGDQAFHYIGDLAFTHHRGELHEIQLANKTLVEGDINGDGKADFQIELTGHLHLVKGDFIL